jgi:ketosteroid isomerase-like protein
MIDANAIFTQPLAPDARGHTEIERMFGQLFALIPDLLTTPRRSAVNGEIVFIESECTGTVGAKPIHFPVCDRFIIREGKIIERHSYTDPLLLIGPILSRPGSWLRALRSRRP